MAFDPFIGWTQVKLEAALLEAQEDLAYGKTLAGGGSGDASANYLVQQQAANRIELLYKKLTTLDPTAYPPASISRLDRTRARFNTLADDSTGA